MISLNSSNYSRASSTQNRACLKMANAMVSAIVETDLSSPACVNSFSIADFGCAYGRNSNDLLRPLVRVLDNQGINSVHLYRCDLPSNNFSSLATFIDSFYREGHGRLFDMMVPKSFNDQVLPDGTLDFSVCCNALHWVQTLNQPRGNSAIHFETPIGSEIARKYWLAQWRRFLKHRSRESKSSAILLVQHIGRFDEDLAVHAPFRLLEDSLNSNIFLSSPLQQIREVPLPIYRATKQDILSPFKDGKYGGWELESSFDIEGIDSSVNVNLDSSSPDFVDWIRGFSEAYFLLNLPNVRTEELDRLFDRARELWRLNPENYAPNTRRIGIQLRKF